jgi:transposase
MSKKGGMRTRLFGFDVHREFTQIAMLEGDRLTHLGRIPTTPEALRAFAQTLDPEDHVVLEATTNTYAIVQVLQQHVGRVVVSNPLQTRAIADAKIKTDKVDAEVLVRLLSSGWLPEVWVPDAETQALRQQVAHRTGLVRHHTRLKNRVHSVLIRNLVPHCPRSDLFGRGGRQWLMQQALPQLPRHEQAIVTATLRELDAVNEELTELERTLAAVALAQPAVRRLMTIPGIDAVTALAILAAIGDVRRFRAPSKLVAYLGLDPRIRQSGSGPVRYGRISKRGQGHARAALVEAAWAAVKVPGPLRAFYQRLRNRRGGQIAVVATARKLVVVAWHLLTRDQDYAFVRPSLVAKKWRALELQAGHSSRRGQRGSTYAYNLKPLRDQEREIGVQAERAYMLLTQHWQPRRIRQDAGAANGTRR